MLEKIEDNESESIIEDKIHWINLALKRIFNHENNIVRVDLIE